MSFKKKLALGFQKKPREQREIDNEYQFHAVNVGHKLDTIRELEEQISDHQRRLVELKAESKARSQVVEKQPQAQAAVPAPAEAPAPQVSP